MGAASRQPRGGRDSARRGGQRPAGTRRVRRRALVPRRSDPQRSVELAGGASRIRWREGIRDLHAGGSVCARRVTAGGHDVVAQAQSHTGARYDHRRRDPRVSCFHPGPSIRQKVEELADAVLYLGPPSTITRAPYPAELCEDQAFLAMRIARVGNPGGPLGFRQTAGASSVDSVRFGFSVGSPRRRHALECALPWRQVLTIRSAVAAQRRARQTQAVNDLLLRPGLPTRVSLAPARLSRAARQARQ